MRMAEAGFARRVAPALVLTAAGGLFLYLLPTGADSAGSTGEEISFPDATAAPSAATSGSPASGAGVKRVIDGDPVEFKYGTIQVKVALDGTTIVDIATMSGPGGSYQQYTDLAVPDMKAKILAAQSTRVAAASGATYTAEAYAQSVQSALDKA